ncbi:hypothetical protein [uncultured Microbacterium sp.]|uniref:hypothetical protein n=1 Tax=uncultured Microbacterium sp. TaxID=191216 RepID=UPI0025DBC16A|nr:hypothetical protein [uncultured Microbacterium sp.]
MTGIVGVDLPVAEVHQVITDYLAAFYGTIDALVAKHGQGWSPKDESWKPELPAALRPSWAVNTKATADGHQFYFDLTGPSINGIEMAQDIVVELSWTGDFEKHTVESIKIREAYVIAFEQELTLQQAREATVGMIAAGKLLASLLEPPQEVR